jgi:hypothetical protein
MRRHTLGEALRAIVLSTPFVGAIAGIGCQPDPCGGAPFTNTFVIDLASLTDGGAVAFLPDGGSNDGGCFAACASVPDDLYETFLQEVDACHFQTTDDGQPGVSCTVPNLCVGGRLPFTFVHRPNVASLSKIPAVGAFFARAAQLEAASVHAFRILATELRAHGAPESLIAAARRSALDEVRHARWTSWLARRYGARPLRAVVRSSGEPRSLEAMALENAVEGCARETVGAAVGLWQARHSRDPQVREALGSIAADEVRHAELSWEVARWGAPRLSRAARLRIADARSRAFDQLDREVDAPVPSPLITLAGLPPPAIAKHLVKAVRGTRLHV